ncbi:beta-lactamase [Flammeovirgaceae bacterium 311]|nr:beta-lactamase [Flammeovirgaceae bacterium 311]
MTNFIKQPNLYPISNSFILTNKITMKKLYSTLLLFFLFLPAGLQVNAQSLEKDLDALFDVHYPSGQPGAIVLVAKDGNVIYRKAFGSADLELGVPMKPEHVIELGSITKQFTAVAILMLMEEGKLSLQDPLSKYISDYPNGENITIHHLLNHTSGIPNHLGMPELPPKALDISPLETIAVFKNKPGDFAPGEKWKYSNAGYILLGYIIEQASKMTYEDFIETKIFQPLGMRNSQYGNKREIIPNRASGYNPDPSGKGYRNGEFLSMTVPYAGGALMSTVDDMLIWNQAVRNNNLISEKNKQLTFKTTTLNNGETSYYGYGREIRKLYGSPTLEHGGGVSSGYLTFGVYLPKENIYTILLSNNHSINPEKIALDATAIVMGKPMITSKTQVSLPENTLKQWTGSYIFEDGALRHITFKDGNLYSKREGTETSFPLLPISANEYRFHNGSTTYTFGKENGKKVVVFATRLDVSNGKETDKAPVE